MKDEKVDEEDAAVWEAKASEIDSVSDAAGVKEALLVLSGGEVAMVDEFLASLPEAPSGEQACSMAVEQFFAWKEAMETAISQPAWSHTGRVQRVKYGS